MAETQTYPGPDPESFILDVLNSRPVIPADWSDISEHQAAAASAEGSEPGYAWERLPLWLAEVKEPYDRIGKTPIIALDLCSSVPIYAQILRSLEFDRDGARGRELVRELFNPTGMQRLGEEEPELRPLAHAIGRDQATRDLLEAAVQESLYEITTDEAQGTSETNPLYRGHLQEKLRAQATTYVEDRSTQTPEVGRGFRVTSMPHEQTYLERLAALPVPTATLSLAAIEARDRLRHGSRDPADEIAAASTEPAGLDRAARFINWQAAHLAEMVVGEMRYRPARFLSMDVSSPSEIATSSIQNTPPTTQSLDVFSHAVNSLFDQTSHFTGNLFDELPVPDGSLALLTCYDGWPAYFQTDDREAVTPEEARQAIANTLQGFYNKLAYGGKMVFFPWSAVAESDGEREAINQVLIEAAAEFGAKNGVPFDLRGIHRKTLHEWMSPSDRTTSADMSPILQAEDDYFFALIISKPKESSVRASNNWLARMAVSSEAQA